MKKLKHGFKGTKQEITEIKSKKKRGEFRFTNFVLQETEIEIAEGDVGYIELHFLPMVLGRHECSIILVDDDVGEMEYKVEAKCLLPKPFKIPHIQYQMDKQEDVKIPVTPINP